MLCAEEKGKRGKADDNSFILCHDGSVDLFHGCKDLKSAEQGACSPQKDAGRENLPKRKGCTLISEGIGLDGGSRRDEIQWPLLGAVCAYDKKEHSQTV